jgi:hypothetical protein
MAEKIGDVRAGSNATPAQPATEEEEALKK